MIISRTKIPFIVCESKQGETDTTVLHRCNEAAVPFDTGGKLFLYI